MARSVQVILFSQARLQLRLVADGMAGGDLVRALGLVAAASCASCALLSVIVWALLVQPARLVLTLAALLLCTLLALCEAAGDAARSLALPPLRRTPCLRPAGGRAACFGVAAALCVGGGPALLQLLAALLVAAAALNAAASYAADAYLPTLHAQFGTEADVRGATWTLCTPVPRGHLLHSPGHVAPVQKLAHLT